MRTQRGSWTARLHDPVGAGLPRHRIPFLVLVVALLAGAWVAVYVAGGTRTALPHLFYLPVVVAVVPFGRRGGITVGVVAMLLCGPAMPLDVAAGTPQGVGNWLVRGLFFVAVGAVAGTAVRAVTSGFERDLVRHFHQQLTVRSPADGVVRSVQQVREVLDLGQFNSVFQPIYDLDDGELLAVEALTRFHDTLPPQPPDVWFARAAQVGLGVEFELATLEAALEAARDLPEPVALALNASPAVLDDPRMSNLLDRHAHRRLIVEVTEHAIVDDYTSLQAAVAGLRQRGIRLAVDDAGAGFASLRHIVRLVPDIIKLDISLTRRVREDPILRALASALVQFAHQTSTALVAEGIETTADLLAWQDLGAHAAQGFLLARPAPPPIRLDACPIISRLPGRRPSLEEVANPRTSA